MSETPIYDEMRGRFLLVDLPMPEPPIGRHALRPTRRTTMPDAAAVLAQAGIIRPVEVVSIANAAGLEVAVAAAMLLKESGGGNNVFGHDAGATVKGGTVTEAKYKAYLADVKAGRSGRQGVGPTQLTYGPFQDRADARGGCWRWEVNCAVGFEILAGYVKANGVQNAGSQYNGGQLYSAYKPGHAARIYGDDLVAKTQALRKALKGADVPSVPASTPVAPSSGRGSLREGDTGAAVAALQRWLNATFPAYSRIDLGPQRYGPQTVAVVAEFQRRAGVTGPDADGRTVGPRTWAALEQHGYR